MKRALIVALLLGACASPPRELPPPPLPERAGVDPLVAARAEGIAFRAVGDGFVLDIFHEARIRLTITASGETLVFPKPEPRYPRWNGSIYETQTEAHRLNIQIRDDRPCEGPDRALYPTTVALRFDGNEMRGCGRAL